MAALITVTCSCCSAVQTIRVEAPGEPGMVWARTLAGLLDGSSPYYASTPPASSGIGRCCSCAGPISARVEPAGPPRLQEQEFQGAGSGETDPT